jgi:NAD(P)H-hydrate epimerase
MAEVIDVPELARLIAATGRAHHAAFAASDGYDPDWAMWYAGHLQAVTWGRLAADGSVVPRAELTYLLVAADRAYRAAGETTRGSWPDFYARYLLAQLSGG